MNRFVIFDRDGTLIKHVHHLSDPSLVEFQPGLIECLQILKKSHFKFGIITNQSVIGRGIATTEIVSEINLKIINYIKRYDLDFSFILMCPHLPSEACNCRKPRIGLGIKAIEEYSLDPSNTFMVGDQISDIQFGKRLEFNTIILSESETETTRSDYTCSSLIDAARWIVTRVRSPLE